MIVCAHPERCGSDGEACGHTDCGWTRVRPVHPAVTDAYEKGYQDGVLETISQLVTRYDGDLSDSLIQWTHDVRSKVEADRGR